jgi:hypothetical protein
MHLSRIVSSIDFLSNWDVDFLVSCRAVPLWS